MRDSGHYHPPTRMAAWMTREMACCCYCCCCSNGTSSRPPRELWRVLSVDPSSRPTMPCDCLRNIFCDLVRRTAVLIELGNLPRIDEIENGDGDYCADGCCCCCCNCYYLRTMLATPTCGGDSTMLACFFNYGYQ